MINNVPKEEKALISYELLLNDFSSFRSVGNATAAFALAVLEGSTQPGVWFPEEVIFRAEKIN